MDISALEKLAELKDKGILSDKEFDEQKARILTKKTIVKNTSVAPSSGWIIGLIITIVLVILGSFIIKFIWFAMVFDAISNPVSL